MVSETHTRPPVRLLFIVQAAAAWSSFRSVYRSAVGDPRFAVKVVLSPFYHHLSPLAPAYEQSRELLAREGVSYITHEYFALEDFRPDVVFLQNPYEDTRPQTLQIPELQAVGARIAYIPYGLEMGGGSWNIDAQFNQQIHQTAWRIFARSERHRRLFGRHCEAGNSHVAVTGHPKFDAPDESAIHAQWAEKLHGHTVLLWTPHFTVGSPPTWSTYTLYRDVILAAVDRHPELSLLIRPHPLFFQSLRQTADLGAKAERELRAHIDAHPRIALDENAEPHAAFARSSALMTDVGSFLLEYLPTGKPLLYLHHPMGLGMNGDGELVSHLDTAQTPDEVAAFIARVAGGLDPMQAVRAAAVPEFLHGLDGHIGQAICEEVLRGVRSGDASSPRLGYRSNVRMQNEDYWRQWVPSEHATAIEESKLALVSQLLDSFPAADRALDIGCGGGRLTLAVAQKAKSLVAADISVHALVAAGQMFEAHGQRNVRLMEGAMESLRLDEKFDLVTCFDVLTHIADDNAYLTALDKLPQLCRHESLLVTCDTLQDGSEQLEQHPEGHYSRHRSVDQYRDALAKRGFTFVNDLVVLHDPRTRQSVRFFVFQFKDPTMQWLATSRDRMILTPGTNR